VFAFRKQGRKIASAAVFPNAHLDFLARRHGVAFLYRLAFDLRQFVDLRAAGLHAQRIERRSAATELVFGALAVGRLNLRLVRKVLAFRLGGPGRP